MRRRAVAAVARSRLVAGSARMRGADADHLRRCPARRVTGGAGRHVRARRRRASATRTSRPYGNGGYDVAELRPEAALRPGDRPAQRHAPRSPRRPRPDLSRFNLDLTGLTVEQVTVDGAAARPRPATATSWSSRRPPAIAAGAAVHRGGRLRRRARRDPRRGLGETGFLHTADGAFAIGEPRVGRAPGSRSTTTRATRRPTPSTIDRARRAERAQQRRAAGPARRPTGWTTWRWAVTEPMAPLPGHRRDRPLPGAGAAPTTACRC